MSYDPVELSNMLRKIEDKINVTNQLLRDLLDVMRAHLVVAASCQHENKESRSTMGSAPVWYCPDCGETIKGE